MTTCINGLIIVLLQNVTFSDMPISKKKVYSRRPICSYVTHTIRHDSNTWCHYLAPRRRLLRTGIAAVERHCIYTLEWTCGRNVFDRKLLSEFCPLYMQKLVVRVSDISSIFHNFLQVPHFDIVGSSGAVN